MKLKLRKALAAVLSLCMVALLMPATAFAEGDQSSMTISLSGSHDWDHEIPIRISELKDAENATPTDPTEVKINYSIKENREGAVEKALSADVNMEFDSEGVFTIPKGTFEKAGAYTLNVKSMSYKIGSEPSKTINPQEGKAKTVITLSKVKLTPTVNITKIIKNWDNTDEIKNEHVAATVTYDPSISGNAVSPKYTGSFDNADIGNNKNVTLRISVEENDKYEIDPAHQDIANAKGTILANKDASLKSLKWGIGADDSAAITDIWDKQKDYTVYIPSDKTINEADKKLFVAVEPAENKGITVAVKSTADAAEAGDFASTKKAEIKGIGEENNKTYTAYITVKAQDENVNPVKYTVKFIQVKADDASLAKFECKHNNAGGLIITNKLSSVPADKENIIVLEDAAANADVEVNFETTDENATIIKAIPNTIVADHKSGIVKLTDGKATASVTVQSADTHIKKTYNFVFKVKEKAGSSEDNRHKGTSSSGSAASSVTTAPEPSQTSTPAPAANTVAGFHDVTTADWFAAPVQYVVEKGLMNGTGAGFAPNETTTRGMIAAILYRMDGSPAVEGASGFADIPADQWFTAGVTYGVKKGILNGVSDKEFAPNVNITREQIALMFYRYAQTNKYDVSARGELATFKDAGGVSNYATEALQWCVGAGLINGMDGKLNPQGYTTRAQAAAIMQRFMTTVAKPAVPDTKSDVAETEVKTDAATATPSTAPAEPEKKDDPDK